MSLWYDRLSENSQIEIYIASKFLGYSLWALLGLLLDHAKYPYGKAVYFGVVRLFIGIGFGLFVYFLGGVFVTSHNVLWAYLAIYTPLRWLEWSLLSVLMNPKARFLYAKDTKGNLWRAGGIILSFAIDFLSPEGMKGMFCIGRCLC